MLFLFGGGGGEKYDTSDVSYFNRSNLVIWVIPGRSWNMPPALTMRA